MSDDRVEPSKKDSGSTSKEALKSSIDSVRANLVAAFLFQLIGVCIGWNLSAQAGTPWRAEFIFTLINLVLFGMSCVASAERPVGSAYLVAAWSLITFLFIPLAHLSSNFPFFVHLVIAVYSARKIRRFDRYHA